jgi:hypothetical protein
MDGALMATKPHNDIKWMVSCWALVHFFHFFTSFFLGVRQENMESTIIYGWVKAHYNDPSEVSPCTTFQGCACLGVSHPKLLKDFHKFLTYYVKI